MSGVSFGIGVGAFINKDRLNTGLSMDDVLLSGVVYLLSVVAFFSEVVVLLSEVSFGIGVGAFINKDRLNTGFYVGKFCYGINSSVLGCSTFILCCTGSNACFIS